MGENLLTKNFKYNEGEVLQGVKDRIVQYLTRKTNSNIRAKHMTSIGLTDENHHTLYRRFIESPSQGKLLFQIIYRMSVIFPELNLKWLFNNQGEPELPQTGFVITNDGILMTHDSKPSAEMPIIIRNFKEKEQINMVPSHLLKDYADKCNDPEFVVNLPYINTLHNPNDIFRDFEVIGDSLKPYIQEKDIIRGKFIPKSKYFALPMNEVMVVVTSQNVFFSVLVRNSNEELVLHSVNKLIDDVTLNVKDVREVWLFNRLITDRNPIR